MQYANVELDDGDVRRITEVIVRNRGDVLRYFEERYGFTRSQSECIYMSLHAALFNTDDVCEDHILGWMA